LQKIIIKCLCGMWHCHGFQLLSHVARQVRIEIFPNRTASNAGIAQLISLL